MNCPICGRNTPNQYTEKHHLVPRCKHGKEVVLVCIDCGDQVHQLFSEKELRDEYNTIDKLIAHTDIQKWIKWIRKQKNFGICMKAKKKR
jgi:hypothetical protein